MAHKGKHSSSITSIPATLQTEATTKISDVSLFSSVDDVISACQPPASSYPQSCSICFQEFCGDCCNFALIVLPYCRSSHCFCRNCARRMLDTSGKCGVCMKYYIASTGTQPVNGRMRVAVLPPSRLRLPGHEDCGVIVIRYEFPSGVQGPEHPNAGQRYRGTKRQAYLPDNELGRKVLAMLQTCFQRRLTFTVGRSVTTGQDNCVIWNGIHHKTNVTGGSSRFGYPDETYLHRVMWELNDKGITG